MAGMTSGSPGRAWPWFDAALFSAALLLFALAMPLGLARVEAAPKVAASIALDIRGERAALALVLMRLVELLPLGDQALRANLATALFGAAAVALLGRLCIEMLVLLRPAANARQEARDFLHEPITAAAAALAVALSLSTFDVATTGGTAAATLLLLLAGLLAGLALLRDCCSAGAGYALALLAGLSAGVDAVAGPLLWPLFVGVAIWALRMGARWPLFAPLGFVAAWGGSALAAVARGTGETTLGGLLASTGNLSAHTGAVLWATAVELGDELGVVGALLAAIGVVVIATRTLLVAAWLGVTLLSALLFALPARQPGLAMGPAAAALPLAIATSCVLASAGLVHLAGRLGRARMAATLALAIILVLTPAMDGSAARRTRRAALPMHLLQHALDRVELRSLVDPGTQEMDGLFRLARALGMRPDLVLGKSTDKAR
jgi:hypothetical protein